jgi:phenylpyruvate tautomerase PptA (4-oxalocrotonate tautomerase family)
MPTYVCSIQPGVLSEDQRARIATAITHRHSEATGAPSFFVQVVIEENASSRRYLSGQPASGHIWVRGDIRAGRSEEIREKLMLSIMRDLSEIAGVRKEAVWVYLCNLAPTDMVEYGHVLPAPGGEQVWFENLDPDLQTYLKGLGTSEARIEQ